MWTHELRLLLPSLGHLTHPLTAEKGFAFLPMSWGRHSRRLRRNAIWHTDEARDPTGFFRRVTDTGVGGRRYTGLGLAK